MKDVLKQKEKEHLDKYNKNVDLLKKYTDDKNIMQTNLQNYIKKVKHLEEKLQHVPLAMPEELEASRKGKRDCTQFSSSQEKGLHKPPKQPRVLDSIVYI